MAQGEPSPRQTLALLFGASSFRRAPSLAQGRAFYNSAQDFYEYLTGVNGLGLPPQNVDSLFDDTRSPSDQLQDIREFLESRSTALKGEGLDAQDLIVYYVGHGLFSGADYCLAVRSTDARSEGMTSIRVSDLASIIKNSARFVRKFFILDCCFSAAAYKEFQSSPLSASRVKLLQELPQRGTALLCSASAQDPSLAPVGRSHTMFSGALLSALHHGHGSLGPRLSLSELGDLVKAHIHETYPDTAVRPEVHSPDQREGDVADVPLFPNTSFLTQKAKEEEQKAEAAAAERERIAQENAEGERKERERAEAAEQERKARVQAEFERQAREQAAVAERERIAREKAEAERRAREQAEAELHARARRYKAKLACRVIMSTHWRWARTGLFGSELAAG
jgi:hypothetical protein